MQTAGQAGRGQGKTGMVKTGSRRIPGDTPQGGAYEPKNTFIFIKGGYNGHQTFRTSHPPAPWRKTRPSHEHAADAKRSPSGMWIYYEV